MPMRSSNSLKRRALCKSGVEFLDMAKFYHASMSERKSVYKKASSLRIKLLTIVYRTTIFKLSAEETRPGTCRISLGLRR